MSVTVLVTQARFSLPGGKPWVELSRFLVSSFQFSFGMSILRSFESRLLYDLLSERVRSRDIGERENNLRRKRIGKRAQGDLPGEAPAVLAPCRSRELRGFGYVWHVGFREESIQSNLWHYEPMAKSSVESSDGSRLRLPQDRRSKM